MQQETGKKRLSLDVFQEKAVGTSHEADQAGNAVTSWLCVSVILTSIILTVSSDSSRCCTSSDCHATN
jgi:hypothetical protein